MLISEAARKSHTTKKAIEYYVEQQLLDLQTQKNGYRQFTEKDIEKLKKISVLRRFGLSVQEIKHILDDPKQETIQRIIEKNKLEQKEKETKNALFEQLAKTQDWESAGSQLDILEKRKTIQEKLIDTFPGYYGKYIQLHFGKYLNEPILCEEQQEAFETIIAFLDQAEFKLSDDLRTVLDEMTSQFDEQFVNNTFETMNQIIQDPKQYMKDNKEMIEQYLQIKRSEPFKRSKASQLQQQLMAGQLRHSRRVLTGADVAALAEIAGVLRLHQLIVHDIAQIAQLPADEIAPGDVPALPQLFELGRKRRHAPPRLGGEPALRQLADGVLQLAQHGVKLQLFVDVSDIIVQVDHKNIVHIIPPSRLQPPVPGAWWS